MTAGRRTRRLTGESRRAGIAFTLIEVLATLVLVGIVLPVVVDGILLSLATAGYARDQSEAASLAQNLMSEIVVSGDYQDSESSGQFGTHGLEYRSSAQWNEWEDPRLMQLTVTVSWQRRSQERDVTLSTLVYSGSGE